MNRKVYVEPATSLSPLPERSRLFCLDPIGVGTAGSESLISYIVRLARKHMVNPRSLIRAEFMGRYKNAGGIRSSGFFGDYAKTINGIGAYAEGFSKITEDLTGQSNLSHLTMLPWRGVVPEIGAGLVAKEPKWCKQCLLEQRTMGVESHFRLSWSLHLYQACVEHGQRLSSQCPWCRKSQPPIPYLPDQGRCAYCGGWLGAPAIQENLEPSQEAIWLARAIENMVANNPSAHSIATPEVFQAVLTQLVREFAHGEKEAFSKRLGLTATSLSAWTAKGKKPLFPQFLHLCWGLGLLPVELLAGSHPGKLPGGAVSVPMTLHLVGHRTNLEPAERENIHRQLIAIANDPEDVRPLTDIAASFGVRRTFVDYWFPDLCQVISRKYWKAMRERTRERWAIEAEQVRQITNELYGHGEYPSRRRVEKAITPLKLSLRRRHLRRAYKVALEEASSVPRRL